MRLRISGDAEVFHYGYAAELHLEDLDTPAPSPCTAHLRKLFNRLTLANVGPATLGECCAYLTSAGIGNRILEICNVEYRFSYIIDLPRDNRIKPDRLTIYGRGSQPGKVIRPRSDMFVPDLINMEWADPVETWTKIPLVLAKASEDACLKWLKDHPEEKALGEPLEDLEETVEHLPISLYYPWG